MHTIQPPLNPWGEPPVSDPERYAPKRPNGHRAPGWDDVNITLLASDIGVSFRYLLAVLTGRRNCTLALLQHVAHALGLPLTSLITRMEAAYYTRAMAMMTPKDKSVQRAKRSVKRAIHHSW